MTVEQALSFVDTLLKPESLNHVQELVFRGAWEEQVYQEIAAKIGYDADYLRDVGSKLWRSLSNKLGEKVTKTNFRSVLRRRIAERQFPGDALDRSTPSSSDRNWNVAMDVSFLLGRTEELSAIEQWIVEERCHLLGILGIAGIGKSTLAAKLTEKISDRFQYVIWRSLRNAPIIEEFLADIIPLFYQEQPTEQPKVLDCAIAQLIHCLRSRRCLLILDNFESVLQTGNCKGCYREGYEGYGQLLRTVGETSHQSCLVITSREKPRGLAWKEGKTLPVRSICLGSLQEVEVTEILYSKGLDVTEKEVTKLWYYYGGNPLLLQIVATTIQDLFDGNVAKFLAQKTLVFGDISAILEQEFNRLSDLEKQVMYCLAIKHEWVTLEELQQDISSSISQFDLLEALQSLQCRSLIQKREASFTQQPVIREYLNAIRSFKVAEFARKKQLINSGIN